MARTHKFICRSLTRWRERCRHILPFPARGRGRQRSLAAVRSNLSHPGFLKHNADRKTVFKSSVKRSQSLYDDSVRPCVVPQAFVSIVTFPTKGKSFCEAFRPDYNEKAVCSSSSLSIPSLLLTSFLPFLSDLSSPHSQCPLSPSFPHPFQSSLPSGCLPCR